MEQRHLTAAPSERGRYVIGRPKLHVPRHRLRDVEPELSFTAPFGRQQDRIDPFDASVPLHETQTRLEEVQIERAVENGRKPMFDPARVQPSGGFDLHVRQPTFDDLDLDDTVAHRLIGNDRARIDVATVEIESCQRIRHPGQVFGVQTSSHERGDDLGQLLRFEERAADDVESPHVDTVRIAQRVGRERRKAR